MFRKEKPGTLNFWFFYNRERERERVSYLFIFNNNLVQIRAAMSLSEGKPLMVGRGDTDNEGITRTQIWTCFPKLRMDEGNKERDLLSIIQSS